MNNPFTQHIPVTPSRQRPLSIRVPLSDRSPIKTADNTFNPTNTSTIRRPRGPNIKPKAQKHRFVIANRENDDVFSPSNDQHKSPVLSTPLTHSLIPEPFPSLLTPSSSRLDQFVLETPDEPVSKRLKMAHDPMDHLAEFHGLSISSEQANTHAPMRGTKRKRTRQAQSGHGEPLIGLLPDPVDTAPPPSDPSAPSHSESTPVASTSKVDDSSRPLEVRLYLVSEYARSLGLPFPEYTFRMLCPPTDEVKSSWEKGGEESKCLKSRAALVSSFLSGFCSYTVSDWLEQLLRHPYGSGHKDSPDMFSLEQSYKLIRPVRPALTAFCAQMVQRELNLRARVAVQPSSGLHVHIPSKRRPVKQHVAVIDWKNLNAQTHQQVMETHMQFQKLLWGLLTTVATPDKNQSTEQDRIYRPVHGVISTVISKLMFSRSSLARLGPMLEGLFNLVSQVSYDKFRYDSHVGNTPAYTTVISALYGLGQQAGTQLMDICRDPGHWFWIILDNVQNYIRHHSLRLGRMNHMNLGMAATVWIAPPSASDPGVFDFDDKQRRRASCDRTKITAMKLLRLPDAAHERHVYAFQWLWVLGNYVPRLENLKLRANELLRTTGRRQKVPDEPTQCFTLPTVSASETKLPEFLDGVLDFLKSAGQTGERFNKRMLPIGGDGLTFELLHKIMSHRQFHKSPFHGLRIMNPKLQWWHLLWTNDARIIDNHMGNPAGSDVSSFGHLISSIGRKLPKEQGKYNYKQASELLYLVLDADILNCWRIYLERHARKLHVDVTDHDDVGDIVETLHAASKLPSVDEFERFSYELHELYTTEEAIYRAATGTEKGNFPRTADQPRPDLISALNASEQGHPPVGAGDSVLASKKEFMREAMRSRECVWAVAEGDVGRVWEQILTLFFPFVASGHKKYAQYILEEIIDICFESSPELAKALLSTLVASLSGKPGTHRCCDLLQEFFQRIIEAIVQHKGAEFGDRFIREAIARCLGYLQRLKEDFLSGVGLDRRSQNHSKPSQDPEMRILLEKLRRAKVHMFSNYRQKGSRNEQYESQFRKGFKDAQDGLLERWTTRMMLDRDVSITHSAIPIRGGSSDFNEDDEDNAPSQDMSEAPLWVNTVHDGNITTEHLDPEADARVVITLMESGLGDEGDDSQFNSGQPAASTTTDGFETDNDDIWDS
ncbi:hypothetical protein VNI00_016918 [Paramarasmius palmivorus]|uniref:DUF6589 domain-containing protein n=1 Tax=Paramarasmius palmivorus TaxID=297713 RepID=A0AAW0BC63_9AGAR